MRAIKSKRDVRGLVFELVAQYRRTKPGELSENTDLLNDLGLDSLDKLELVIDLEDTLDINIPDEKTEHIR